MRRLLVPATLAAVAALLVSAVGASANGNGKRERTTTIRVIAREEAGQFVDLPPTATRPEEISQGDMFVFTSRLFMRGERVGRLHVVCTLTVARGPRSIAQCVATARLPGGQITVQGVSSEARRFTVPITGGSGRYRAARGTLEVRELRGDREALTFRIIR